MLARGADAQTCFGRLGEDVHALGMLDVRAPYLGMAAVGHAESVVETAEYGMVQVGWRYRKHAEPLGWQEILGDAVETVKRSHGSPAQIERAAHVAVGPVHDGRELAPIVYLFIGDGLYRCAGDYHAVEVLICQFVGIPIEAFQMFCRCIL